MIKTALEYLAGLLGREAAATGRFVDDLPPVPDGVRDAFMWRLANGTYQPDVPARRRREERTLENSEVRFRDGPG
jgi:hypothetical protein